MHHIGMVWPGRFYIAEGRSTRPSYATAPLGRQTQSEPCHDIGMDNVRAAAVQFESIQADKPANLETIRRFAAQAAERDVQLLVFPECCITGYWFLRKLSREQLDQSRGTR